MLCSKTNLVKTTFQDIAEFNFKLKIVKWNINSQKRFCSGRIGNKFTAGCNL